jgi:hypothetical protein
VNFRLSMLFLLMLTQVLGWPRAFAQDPRPADLSTPAAVPPDLRIYLNAKSVVNESPSQIIARIPELKDIAFVSSQEELGPLLQKIGENIQALFQDFPNTGSVEDVRFQRSSTITRTSQEIHQKYLYLLSLKIDARQLRMDEYRTDSKGRPLILPESRRGFMLTSGYVTQALVFHPLEQPGCLFRLLGRTQKKPEYLLVAYAQRPEIPQFHGILSIGGASIVLLHQGVAWIDPETYRVIRLWTDLLVPRGDFGVSSHTTDTLFQEVRFDDIDHPFWLPRQVEVKVKWGGDIYSNRHLYSDYKVFSVDAKDGEKKLAKP